MFKVTFVGSLATLQFFAILLKVALSAVDIDISWFWVLTPLWALLGVAALFWAIFVGIAAKLA